MFCWKKNHWIVLGLILLVAAGMRLWRLGELPPAMFRDEAEKALNGWFLLQGGVDAHGRSWPIFIKVFGVTTSALYQYATIPFLAIGGLNEWTARLPAACVGILTVVLTWVFCSRVWNWQTAAWASLLLAISPWHVPLSRWAQQGIFLPLFFIMAAYGLGVFLRSLDNNARDDISDGRSVSFLSRCLGLMLTAACLALAMYTYDPARLVAPLLALAALVIWWKYWVKQWKCALVAFTVFLLFLSPVIWLMINHGAEAQARFRFLSIVQGNKGIGEILKTFLGNYLAHFSPDFLLIHGDHELRHSGGVGMLNVVELAFAIWGMIIAIRRRGHWELFMVAWILLSPVASSLTRVGIPHALRSQMALPAWQVLAGIGIYSAITMLSEQRRRLGRQLVFLGVLSGSLPFCISYFGSYSQRAAIHWQYGVRQSLAYLNNPSTANSHVIFTYVTGAEYLVPFYLGMDRNEFIKMLGSGDRYDFFPVKGNDLFSDTFAQPEASGPAAWVTLPGVPSPVGTFAIPIRPPGGNEQTPPSMLIYLNETLLKQVKDQE